VSRYVCVYCGSRPGTDPAFADAAHRLGAGLAQRQLGLVYGGASVGLMGTVADAALAAGAPVRGVIPTLISDMEVAHHGLTELKSVGSMHERKTTMAEWADAFVALPGGIGTLEEIFEIWTWAHLGLHDKPIGLLNVNGYYDALLAFLDHSVRTGLFSAETHARLIVASQPDDLLERIVARLPAVGSSGFDAEPT